MIILGEDAIVIDMKDARKLVNAFLTNRGLEDIKELQKLGVLNLLDELRSAVRRHDGED